MKKMMCYFLSILFCTNIYAQSLQEFVLFGDNLSDDGNLYKIFKKIIPKSPPYYEGRFSNGPTWAEYVGNYYKETHQIKFRNLAYGGATAMIHNPVWDKFIAPVTLNAELLQYLLTSKNTDKSKVLYGIFIGANDYTYDDQVNESRLVNRVADKIFACIQVLIAHGAKYFVILNLPDASRVPYAVNHNKVQRLHRLSVMHKQKLEEMIDTLKKLHPEVKFILFDTYAIFNDFLDNIDIYNKKYQIKITNTKDACWKGGMTHDSMKENKLKIDLQKINTKSIINYISQSPTLKVAFNTGNDYQSGLMPCAIPNEYIFWDEVHPTAAVHTVMGKIFVKTLDGYNIFN